MEGDLPKPKTIEEAEAVIRFYEQEKKRLEWDAMVAEQRKKDLADAAAAEQAAAALAARLASTPAAQFHTIITTEPQKDDGKHDHTNLLPLILRYVDRRDIYNVMQVCHQWYSITQMREFWTRFINEAKAVMLIQVKPTADAAMVRYHIRTFDTFAFSRESLGELLRESLRDQVEWIFHVSPEWVVATPGGMMKRRLRDGKWCRCSNLGGIFGVVTVIGAFHEGNPVGAHEYYLTVGGIVHFYVVCTYDGDSPVPGCIKTAELKYCGRPFAIKGSTLTARYTGQIGFHNPKNTFYNHDGLNILPHGNGRWVFSDGRVLRGGWVAVMGEPRWTIVDVEAEVARAQRAPPRENIVIDLEAAVVVPAQPAPPPQAPPPTLPPAAPNNPKRKTTKKKKTRTSSGANRKRALSASLETIARMAPMPSQPAPPDSPPMRKAKIESITRSGSGVCGDDHELETANEGDDSHSDYAPPKPRGSSK